MAAESSDPRTVLVCDVGGSHVSAALCHLDDLRILHRATAPLGPETSSSEFLDLIRHLGKEVIGDSCVKGAVLAVPGPFDCLAGVSQMRHKLKSLYGVDLRRSLAARFRWKPQQVRFLNDAAAFLLGEVKAGSARGAMRAVGIALGTGIGSAFACDGRWVTEGSGVPPGGEIWNLSYAGGIVEDLLSTRAIKREYAMRTATEEDVERIAASAGHDEHARAVFESFGVNLGRVLVDIVAPFAPDVIVLGGGISRSAHLFLPFAQNQINGISLKLVTSSLLDEAPLVGAAGFWRDGIDISPEPACLEPAEDHLFRNES